MKQYIVGVLFVFSVCSSAQHYQLINNYNSLYKEPGSHFSISVKSSSHDRYRNNIYASNVYRLSRWSALDFAHYFGCTEPNILSEKQQKNILSNFKWYKFAGFREYIQQFPLYEKHIEHLYNRFQESLLFWKVLRQKE